jgi:Cu(I)/Ag(I) efflux system membrane fusion protein
MKIFPILLSLFLLSLPAYAAGPVAPKGAVYQCAMHPWIKSDHPGKCTICGMELALAGSGETEAPGVIALAASSVTAIGLETSVVTQQALTRTLRVTGRIDDDDTRHRILSARVPGRVEKLHINFVGAEVAANAPLATIYSPEMLTAQRVYVERLKAGEGAFPATERLAARERLLELGLGADDVTRLEEKREPSALIVIRAPEAGTVVSKSVYEGQYVQTADRLFEIADFSRMWFVFDVYEQDLPWVHIGQTVEITTRAVPGEVITAPVAFIDPNFDEFTRTTKARAVISNPHPATSSGASHSLPHRVLAEGRVIVETPAVLAAPRSAILDRGAGPVAYVDRGDHHYEQRSLKTGRRGDGLVEILSGLADGDRVVTNGALILDAQAQLANEARSSRAPAAPTAPDPSHVALAAAAIDSAAALGVDDYAGYKKLFPELAAAAKSFPSLPPLELGDNLAAARRSFEPWSTAVADLLKPYRAALGLKIFQCPMSPVLRTGRWVQRSQPIKNPFFGSTMADCGEEIP